MSADIQIASTDADIAACHPVMAELRPHLSADQFVSLVRHLESVAGLKLAFLALDGDIKSVAGFRISEWLAGGRYLEIEDLVTKATDRSHGHGAALFNWLKALAAESGCRQLRLVSNVTRKDAHRFYQREGMTLNAHYFSINTA